MVEKKVSIIIPVYNSGKYLSEAIDSCINQSYANIEIIIVDDGSSDNCLSIAKSYECDKVKVFSQENKGACAARNYGFRKSTGDYIQFLDADDYLSLDKIENQINLISNEGGKVISSCNWARFYDSTSSVIFPKRWINRDYRQPINWLLDCWNGSGMGQTSIWLTPRVLIEKSGLWNEDLLVNQDGEFFSRVILNASGIKYCDKSHVYYRSGLKNSVSKVLSFEKANSLLESYICYENSIFKHGKSDKIINALAENYLSFIYQYYQQYPALTKKAKSRLFNSLRIKKLKPSGGKSFKFIAYLIGFENALKLKYFFNLYLNI